MKRSAVLMMAAISFVAMGNLANAAEETPDPLAADTQLIILETDTIVASRITDDEDPAVEDHAYQYGEKLDIRKVIAVKSDAQACGITPATMTYQDSQGEVHTLRYQVVGQGCQNG